MRWGRKGKEENARRVEKAGTKLAYWRQKLGEAVLHYDDTLRLMQQRDAIYGGTAAVDGPDGMPAAKRAQSVFNLAYELIEGQVDSNIPMPRVSAMRPEDAHLAAQIEDMLRAKVDALPFEEMNDIDERNTYNQGGDFALVEWDCAAGSHTVLGDLAVSIVHPRQVIPQDGVCELSQMDYFFIRSAMTRQRVEQRYGVVLADGGEEDADVRGGAAAAADIVTLNTAYYRGKEGIGRFVFSGDVVLEDLPDYQARHGERCQKCGAPRQEGQEKCGDCGGRFRWRREAFEEITQPLVLSGGEEIPVESVRIGEDGLPVLHAVPNPDGSVQRDEGGRPVMVMQSAPTRIPYYKPDVWPLVMRRNVSKFGTLLGVSDIDVIRPQQEAAKKLTTNVMEKLMKGGSYVTLPAGVRVETSDAQLKVLRVENPAQKALIDVLNIQPNISYDMSVLADQYEKARSVLGITNSFQGKPDGTAQSGTAKQFAAAQTAGRLESKRRMKNAFYGRLYEVMFKFMLAYADQPVRYRTRDAEGNEIYTQFNRYDFLKRDAAGEYYWEDDFLFSVDSTGGLAQNREAMWSEAERKFTSGAMGDVAENSTRVLYWTLLEQLQFPLAKSVKQALLCEAQGGGGPAAGLAELAREGIFPPGAAAGGAGGAEFLSGGDGDAM